MDSPETEYDIYLAMWDCDGLEYLTNVSEYQRNAILHILKHDVKPPPPVSMNSLLLRARFNQQRNYEIYTFSSELDEQSIRDLFESDPQTIVDTIRRIGENIYSDRLIVAKRKIK